MADVLVIDTDILIDVARGNPSATSLLQTLQQTYSLSISSVTEELIVGCRNNAELVELDSLLHLFAILRLNSRISEIAVALLRQYRLSHGLLIPDALIAGTAIAQNIAFISKNQKDFRFIENLKLIQYP
ncbi:MAG TPA: type II toxin-antitoxin system VapC family toxin [Pyrinomonadaceae bacterium]